MDARRIELIRDSWDRIADKEAFADSFYARLFAEYPEVRPYFKGDMKEQGRKLMGMIGTAVNVADDLESVLQPVQELGVRHRGYGVKPEDYDKVAASLLWTFGQEFSDDFTDELQAAWADLYTQVAEIMKQAADS